MQAVYPPSMQMPKGHYAPAIIHNGIVYVSGQLPINENGEAETGDIEKQTELCLRNIETILKSSGSNLHHILKLSVFIADIGNWASFNSTFARIMGDHKPARIVVPCNTLNRGCGIEIDCIAAVQKFNEE
jgi:2-iminobutanoate/2-iminopropanoate deaminase